MTLNRNNSINIGVIGLGYVGLPLAIEFGKKRFVVAYDKSDRRIKELKQGFDHNSDVLAKDLKGSNLYITSDPNSLSDVDFYIIAVPTPIDISNQPDLNLLKTASSEVAKFLKKGDIVVYESTVYPGATEGVCLPILEKVSSLVCGEDFFIGYSPERINPGDKLHTFSTIKKVVAAQNQEVLSIIADVYRSVVDAGVYEAQSIKIAEAAKVIENTQRDINIAFMNELQIIFDKINIDIHEVLQAASTKWNFLNFQPGLVGGHCIGVDPYYLTFCAQQFGYNPQMILSGRILNDNMGRYYAQQLIKKMNSIDIHINNSSVGVLGVSFKENCSDIRNSKVVDLIKELESYHVKTYVYDPVVNGDEVRDLYGVEISDFKTISKLDIFVIATAHNEFKSSVIQDLLLQAKLVLDIKNIMIKSKGFNNIQLDKTACSAMVVD